MIYPKYKSFLLVFILICFSLVGAKSSLAGAKLVVDINEAFTCRFYLKNRHIRGIVLAHHYWADGYVYAFNQLLIKEGTLKRKNDNILASNTKDDFILMVDDFCKNNKDEDFTTSVEKAVEYFLINEEK